MERGSFGRVIVGAVVSAAMLSGCNLKNGGEDLVNGKKLFVSDCGTCHTLQRAGARGVTGPNLDEIGEVTKQRVLTAIRIGGTGQKRMPAGLLSGSNAEAVAEYQKARNDSAVKIAGTTGDTSEQAFAARKDSGLIADVNRALDELRADGTLKQISDKYFGSDVSGA